MKDNRIRKAALFNINDASPAGERFQEPALGLGYIKSYFDRYSHLKDKVRIDILKLDIWNTLLKEDPDIIGISSVTQDYTNAIRYAQKIRGAGSEALIVIGGIHISNLPESFHDIFDLGVMGEGEETFKGLIELIYESGLDKQKLSQLRGVLYKDGTRLVNTGPRALLEDLDILPPPYRKYLKLNAYLHILTARGCPFQCAYCSSNAFWGYRVRFYSAERVVGEMLELIQEYNLKHISIWDDLFAINKKRLHEIVSLVRKNGEIFKDVTFGVTARPNVVDEELCALLKQMQVTRVSLGIESGSDKVLELLRRNVTVEQNYAAVKMLKRHGFLVNAGVILGSPGETLEDLNQTYNFVLNSDLDGGGAGLVVPYPHTDFWDYAKERNLVSPQMDFSKLALIQDFTRLKPDDNFIFLNDNMDRKQFLDIACKIHSIFAKKNTASLFNSKNLNLRNIRIMLSNPKISYPFIVYTLKRLMRSIFRNA